MAFKAPTKAAVPTPWLTTFIIVAFTLVVCSSVSIAGVVHYEKTPAGITDAARDAGTEDDFMRAIWVSPGTQVTYLGRHDTSVTNLRAFLTATTFIKPAVTVDQYMALVGNYYPSGQDLVLMRCQPSSEQHQSLGPILATWPNVFSAILSDFHGKRYSCPPNPSDGNNVMYCAAQGYQDTQQSVFTIGLSTAFNAANQIFQGSQASPGAFALKTNYGIYPAFTGMGFAAAGSGFVDTMNTTQVLRESIVPEYLLENLSLEDAGCRCIQVPEYGNSKTDDVRHTKPVDPGYIWKKGRLRDGACPEVGKLGTTASGPDPSITSGGAVSSGDSSSD